MTRINKIVMKGFSSTFWVNQNVGEITAGTITNSDRTNFEEVFSFND